MNITLQVLGKGWVYKQTERKKRNYETTDTRQNEGIVPNQDLPPLSRSILVLFDGKITFQTVLYPVVIISKQP